MTESSSSFETHFNLLFSSYSIPNIFLPLFGGRAVDRYGSWQMLLVFAICIVIGQFIFACGKKFSTREKALAKAARLLRLGQIIKTSSYSVQSFTC